MNSTWTRGSERYRFATKEDLPRIADMLTDPEVGRWLWFTPGSREMFEQYFAPLIEAQTRQLASGETPHTAVFAVDDAEDGVFLGQGAVVAVEGSPSGFEIGFQLRREVWGRGVGTRLAEFLCAYAVHRCNAYRLEGACLEGNARSRTILSRIGLRHEGTRPGYRLRETIRHTEVSYGAELSQLDTAAIRRVAEEVGLL